MTSLISMDQLELNEKIVFIRKIIDEDNERYILTSLAVSFLRLIFEGIVVASTEFGGKFVVGIDVGVKVEFVVAVVDDVKIDIGVGVDNVDVFEDDERS
jgi:hypothetical protein